MGIFENVPRTAFLGLAALALLLAGCDDDADIVGDDGDDETDFPMIVVPDGFTVEKVAGGLHLPTSLAWDDEGRMYVAEAGGGLFPEQLEPIRILRVDDDGGTTVVADLSDEFEPSLVGIVWHEDAFYVTHRASDLTGAVSRVTMDGQVTTLFDGILDSQSEHQINDIDVGPDGRMYVAVGPTGNAGVVGPSIAPWVMQSPGVHTTPCEDIVLLGKNFRTPDFRTEEADTVLTGAYVPFGTATEPGQTIEGVQKCGGSILAFDPDNAEGTIETHAWGFRNLIGITWDDEGQMYAGENGYDVRGSRPVRDVFDASLRITDDVFWYGVPDFSAGRLPLTEEMFEVPDSLQAPIFIDGELQGTDLGFLINHEASGLTPPTPDVVLGEHPFNSSPSMLDVAPSSWGDFAGHVFVAEWGDLAPPTNPLRGMEPAGFRVARVDPASGGQVQPFFRNEQPGPASRQGAREDGVERPFDVQFGPDGALYVVDYGQVTINFETAPPYQYNQDSGVIWRIAPDDLGDGDDNGDE